MYNKDKVDEAFEFCKDIPVFFEPSPKRTPVSFYTSSEVVDTQDSFFLPPEEVQTDLKKEPRLWIFFRELGTFLLCLLIAYGAARFITDYLVQPTRVEGISMEQTLADGDVLIIDKLSYLLHEPKRFDVVIFPYSMKEYFVKRVIGLPGETIQILNGVIYIDQEPLLEHFGLEELKNGGIAASPITLGADEYFLLGDNRNHSTDSRSDLVGPVSKDKIEGKAWMRIYPFDSIGSLK